MNDLHDEWHIQEVFDKEPKKAVHLISSALFRAEELGKLIIKAIEIHSPLQEAIKKLNLDHLKDSEMKEKLSKLVISCRTQYWKDIFTSKKAIFSYFSVAGILYGIQKTGLFLLISSALK